MHEQELAYDIKNYFPQTVSGDLHLHLATLNGFAKNTTTILLLCLVCLKNTTLHYNCQNTSCLFERFCSSVKQKGKIFDIFTLYKAKLFIKTISYTSRKMSKYLGLDRLGKLYQIVRQNGGLKNTYLKLYRQVSPFTVQILI